MRNNICLGLGAALAFAVNVYAQEYKINKVGNDEGMSFDVLLNESIVTSAPVGSWLTIKPNVPDGKYFRDFTVYDEYGANFNQQRTSSTTKDDLHFLMPDHDVYVKVSYESIRYELVVNDSDNGRLILTFNDRTRSRTKPGTKVVVTPNPSDGYVAESITVTNKQMDSVTVDCVKDTARYDGSCVFDMPSFDVIIAANFVLASELSSSSEVLASSSSQESLSSSSVESSSSEEFVSSSSDAVVSSSSENIEVLSSSETPVSSSEESVSSSSVVESSSSATPSSSSAEMPASSSANTSSSSVVSSSSEVPSSSSINSSSSKPVSSSSEFIVEAVGTEEDMPSCTVKRENMTFYAYELKTVFVCKGRMWTKFDPSLKLAKNVQIAKFSAVVNGKNLQISGANVGADINLLDMQGRVIYNSRVNKANFSLNAPRCGSFVLRIGKQQRIVNFQ